MSPRSGTDADAASVRDVFLKLGYKIKINNDLSCKDILKLLKNGKLCLVCALSQPLFPNTSLALTSLLSGFF